MKKMPITISKKIDLINSMIETVKNLETIPFTYNGGTYPYYILINKILVKEGSINSDNTDIHKSIKISVATLLLKRKN